MTSSINRVTWVIEPGVFPARYESFRNAIVGLGYQVVVWDDDWWSTGDWPMLAGEPVIFHGSLGNAARIASELPWRPGAYCYAAAFACSAWYPSAAHWLLQRQWIKSTVSALAEDPSRVVAPLGNPRQVFVRRDSALKPFSGRVLDVANIDLRALDQGFHYDDANLAVIIAEVRPVGREWRYVVVDRTVVAGSAYAAEGRAPLPADPGGAPWTFAAEIAAQLPPPEAAYVLDICEADGELRLLELNPFSGADLYAADPVSVVRAISDISAR